MKEVVLSLDVGTGSTKGVLYDRSWGELARAQSPAYQHKSRRPGWVEQDPEEIWGAVCRVIRQLLETIGHPVQVLGAAISAQSGSLLPVDAAGEPVYPLITWMDGRTQEIIKRWKKAGRQQVVKTISGWSLYSGLPLPTIAWLRENDQETFQAAARFCSLNDFLAHRLTGRWVSNPSNAGGMQLVDISTGTWSESLCELAGISSRQLAEILPSGAVIGPIRKELCKQLGLSEGARLVNGGHDQACTALGLGITEPGKILLACGTAWVISGAVREKELTQVPPVLDVNFHVSPRRWMVSQSLGGLGASLEWWLEQTRPGDRQARFSTLARSLTETSLQMELMFHPLSGGHRDPATTERGEFSGLQLNHSWGDLSRAVMESAGFELNWAVQESGMEAEEFWMVGGAANSDHWPQILADIIERPIVLPDYDMWPALGAAVLTGYGLGWVKDLNSGERGDSQSSRLVNPGAEQRNLYREKYRRYQGSFHL